MNKLSRTKRYQDLRNSLDEETTLTRSNAVINENADFSHANQPLHPHLEDSVRPNVEFQSSPVMDELLGEVKQYNIENGNRYEDDTQINILRQLDATPSVPRKKAHIVEMEENPETMGNTLKLPKSLNQELDIASFMSHSNIEEETPVREESKVVLKPTNIQVDDIVEEDNLDLLGDSKPVFDDAAEEIEEETVEKKPHRNKKLKKAKKQKEQKEKKQRMEESEEMPSAKMRMMAEDYEEVTENRKGGRIINVVLFILTLLLIATIAIAIFILKDSGVL